MKMNFLAQVLVFVHFSFLFFVYFGAVFLYLFFLHGIISNVDFTCLIFIAAVARE